MNPSTSKDSTKGPDPGKEDTYYALQTIVDKIDYFDSIEKLEDGQYKFTVGRDVVYVLWGDKNLPDEITGQLKVTDVSGSESIVDASEVVLSESPIFVEII